MPEEDEVYIKVKTEVTEILEKNVENIKQVLHIYEKYSYLLSEE